MASRAPSMSVKEDQSSSNKSDEETV
jgi:hypothetical protein